MYFVFFAARQLHKDYFTKVSDVLNSKQQTPHVSSRVLWHKRLWRTPLWLMQLFHCFKPSIWTALIQTVSDHVREKKNSHKGRQRSTVYWLIFQLVKSVESILLFAIYRHALTPYHQQTMVIWNGLKYRQRLAVIAAESLAMRVVYMENGLLPGMTTLDAKGINYRNSVPRKIDAFAQLAPIDLAPLNEALKEQFSDRPAHLPENYIFVPFQVNTDSQVVLFSSWVRDMFDLVQQFDDAAIELEEQMPHIVFKPHPACDENYDELVTRYAGHRHLHFDMATATPVLIQHADAVATINSTVGIEALLLDKKLLVLGQAFYSYPSLSLNADSQQTLQQCLLQLPGWQPNHLHVQQLFNFLYNRYQLPGNWQQADENHLRTCAERLLELSQ